MASANCRLVDLEASHGAVCVVAGSVAAGIIDSTQFSPLVTVVVASAIVPTAVAQRWYSPHVPPMQA
jgi:tetrahydromethanopterin S-methyltransferase subunit E